MEFGLGFKFHFSDQLRVVMRQTYTIANNFTNDQINPLFVGSLKYLQISLALQYGINL